MPDTCAAACRCDEHTRAGLACMHIVQVLPSLLALQSYPLTLNASKCTGDSFWWVHRTSERYPRKKVPSGSWPWR